MDWKDAKTNPPTTYLKGDWDGLASDFVIAETSTGKPFIAQFYKGIVDGHEFEDWYAVDVINQNDWLVEYVYRWTEISD